MRYAVCNELLAGLGMERCCALAAEAGYEGLELAPFTFAPHGVDRIDGATRRAVRDTVRSAGLSVVGLHWLLVGPEGLHLNSPDRAARARTGAYLCALVDCCADLGGRVLVLGSPQQRQLAPGVSAEAGREMAAEALAPAVERAAAAGVRWSLEPLPAPETNFLNTLEECLALDRLLGGGPALGVQLDAKSLCAEADHPARPAPVVLRHAAAAGRFAHFHANDRNRGGPGSGDVAFGPVFRALRQVGYDGWMSVEVFDTSAGPERIARESLHYLRAAEAAARSV